MRNQQLFFLGETLVASREKQRVTVPLPKVEPARDAFSEAMLEDTSTHHRRSALDWVAAIGVHVVILAVLLILPLYFTTLWTKQ